MRKMNFILSAVAAFIISLVGPTIFFVSSLSLPSAGALSSSSSATLLYGLLPILTWVGYLAAGMFIGYYASQKVFIGATLLSSILLVLTVVNTYSIIAAQEQLIKAGVSVNFAGASMTDLIFQVGIKYFLILLLVFIGAWLGQQTSARRSVSPEPLPPQQP